MPEILSLYQLSERLRVPADWLREQAEANRIPHLKAGRRLIFNPAAVTESLARLAAQAPTSGTTEAAHVG